MARTLAAEAELRDVLADSVAVALGPGRSVPPAARPVPLQTEMRHWLRAGMRPVVLQAALQNSGTLLRDGALTISHDIDFGQWELSKSQLPAPEHRLMHDWAAQIPAGLVRRPPISRHPQRLPATLIHLDTWPFIVSGAVWYDMPVL